MKFVIEAHYVKTGISYTAVKKEHDGRVIAERYDLKSEEQAVNFIRERWKHSGAIYFFDYANNYDKTIGAV